MYGASDWVIWPSLLIPVSFIWVCLDSLFEHFHVDEKIANKLGLRRWRVWKWLHGVNFVIATMVYFLIWFLVYALTGFDLLSWKCEKANN